MSNYPVAIIDYGIGGLGLYQLIRKDFPDFPIFYFSDSGATPYGKLSKNELRSRVKKVFAFLRKEGVEQIVVACHSASSVVLPSDKGVIGIRPATLAAVMKRKPRSLGVIGGGRTIRSGYYKRELSRLGINTKQKVAQVLSILVERGETDTPAVHEAVRRITGGMHNCDAILLACTHYPVLTNILKKYVPKHVQLIDPANELYRSVRPSITKVKKLKGKSVFKTTGSKALMKKAGRAAFGVTIPDPIHVSIGA